MNKYEEDLNYFLSQIEKKHIWFYFDKSKEDLKNFINEYLKTNSINTIYNLSYCIKSIIKYMLSVYDSHTFCFYNKTLKLPIKLKFINKDLFIIDAFNDNLKYTKVLKINGFPVEELINKIKNTLPYSTYSWLESRTEEFLSDLNIINELTSINTILEKAVFMVLKDDNKKEYELKPCTKISFKEADNDDITLLDDAIKIKYSKCIKPKSGSMEDFVKKLKRISIANNINNFIIDIRGNTGGDNTVIYPLLKFLSNPNFNIITLTDKSIFSSGRFALIDLVNIGSETIGEGIGTSLNCFGNVETFKLPNSNLIVTYSTKYFDYDFNKMKLIQYTNKHDMEAIKSFKHIFYQPHYYVCNTLDDYKNGSDKVVDEAIKVLRNYM